jgi:5'-3' exonuclease
VSAPLLIADVPWLLYRSFFALPKSIVGADGAPVNALLGTVNTLLAVAEPPASEQPAVRAVAACMGAEQADYRVALYPPYHAHREPMPAELAEQWRRAPALLESLGWQVPSSEELEADDVMYSYAREELAAGGRAWLLTGDRDLYGAVEHDVSVVELGKGAAVGLIGPEQVRERYGVEPAQVPDFIALRGDPSDGLPGAPGVGAKTAAQLLRAHGTLEGVLQAAQDGALKPRTAAALSENAAQLRDFRSIATLQVTPVALPASAPTDRARGAAAARELGMRALAERLEGRG